MPDHQLLPVNIQDNESYRYSRSHWMNAGIDNFTTAPSQNPDSLEIALNILPPLTNSIKRRYGYRTFVPSLDQGTSLTNDQVASEILYGTGFDGSTGYVSTPNAVSVTANSNLSIECWLQTSTTSGGYLIGLISNSTVNAGDVADIAIILNTTGTISLYLFSSGSTTESISTTASYNDGLPHYIVATLSGTTATIFVDGVQVKQSTLSSGIGAISSYFWRLAQGPTGGGSGRSFPSVTYLQAFLSHAAVYPYTLTQAQVTAHYNAATTTSPASFETTVKGDSPSDFWYLTESIRATPPSTQFIYQQTATLVSGASATLSFTNKTTLGNTILVMVGTDNAVVPSVSDNLNSSYTSIVSTSKFHNFYVPVTVPGTTTITVTGSGSASILVLAQELFGPISSPVDQTASGSQGTPVTSFTTPSITTGASPDVVISGVYSASRSSGFTTSLGSGSGFAIGNITSGAGAGVDAGYTVFLAMAYANAPHVGSFSGSWTSSTSGTWQGVTFGLTINATPATTGTTAFDYVGTDNGTYTGTYYLAESVVI